MYTEFDVIIVGSGAAGLTAGIYTSRAGLDTLVLESKTMGGETFNRQLIENYPGFANGIMGPELANAMLEQASNAGAEIEPGEVLGFQSKNGYLIVKTSEGNKTCKGIIIASGALQRKLGVPGEKELDGKGVFYCETCDGPLCAGKRVVVAGGGNSGITAALHLVSLGCAVTVVEFMDTLTAASRVLLDRAEENPGIEMICNTKINAIVGNEWVTGVDIEDRATGELRRLDVQGIYTRIGLDPNTKFVEGILELNRRGEIRVNEKMETAIPGVFAAGIVREFSQGQISTSVGDGATAAMICCNYIAALG